MSPPYMMLKVTTFVPENSSGQYFISFDKNDDQKRRARCYPAESKRNYDNLHNSGKNNIRLLRMYVERAEEELMVEKAFVSVFLYFA